MASLAEIESAIRVADSEGRSDDVLKLHKAYTAVQNSQGDVPARPTPGFIDRRTGTTTNTLDPTDTMNWGEKFVAGNSQQFNEAKLGAQQLANRMTFGLYGDKDKLAAEAAENKRLEEPLMDTGAAKTGALAGRIAMTMPAFAGTGGISTIGGVAPQLEARFLPQVLQNSKVLPQVTRSAAVGGAEGLVKPGENYNPWGQGLWGTILGAGGDIASRGVGRIIAPGVRSASDAIAAQVQRLKDADMPLLLKHTMDNPTITMMTDALQKFPFLGGSVSRAEKAQDKLLTQKATSELGPAVSEVGQGTGYNPMAVVNRTRDTIHADTPSIDVSGVPAELRGVIAEQTPGVALAGKKPSPLLPNIIKTIEAQNAPRPTPGIATSIDQAMQDLNANIGGAPKSTLQGTVGGASIWPPGSTGRGASTPATITPEQFMEARANLNELTQGAQRKDIKAGHAGREALDEAYKAQVGPEQAARFEEMNRMHGFGQDMNRAIEASGRPGPQQLDALRMWKALANSSDQQRPVAESTHELIADLAARQNKQGGGEARTRAQNIIAGSINAIPFAGAGAAMFMGHPGLAATAVGAPLLSHMLLGTQAGAKYMGSKVLSDEERRTLQQFLTAATVSTNR